MRQAFIGVDVGTSSARAGVFDEKGKLLATARHPITVWHEAGSIVEQSSSEIWAACAASVRAAMAEAALPPSAVRGIGFDATCSLVVLDAGANPLTVSTSGEARRNVIVWMDHRAIAEARLVNETHDDVLRHVGGSISPEMEIPKLLWLKRHLPSSYRSAGHFFDLADYLSFRATGSTARSICTLACKWNFLAHERRWSERYFERVGLGDLASDSYAKIGNEIVAPGTPLGTGLTKSAAQDFGLPEGTPVGASLIDAHAGGVGTIGGREKSGKPVDEMHNVYARPEDIQAYRRDGKFPDGAVLVKDVTTVGSETLTTGQSTWTKDIKIWFVMVKDSKGRFPKNDLWGDGWGWALFLAKEPARNVATDYSTDCRTCHVPARRDDWVYVRGYPVLAKPTPPK
jgi:FGGY-family pentulose kinase